MKHLKRIFSKYLSLEQYKDLLKLFSKAQDKYSLKGGGREDLHAFLHDNRPWARGLCEESKWSMTAEQRSRYLINPMPGLLLNI